MSAAARAERSAPAALEDDGGQITATRSHLGSYMAGRFARSAHQSVRAATYYRNALAHDPDNETLLKSAFITEVAIADWAQADVLGEKLMSREPNYRLARLYLGVRAFQKGEFDSAEQHFAAAGSGPIGELTSALARAWVFAGRNQTKQALEAVSGVKQADWAQNYLRFHRALIADAAGQRQTARQSYDRIFKGDVRSLRSAMAFARHAAHAGSRDFARRILNKHIAATPTGHPLALALRTDLQQKDRDITLLVSTPAEGMAEVFYGLGEVLASEGGIDIGTIYLQLSLLLRPAEPLALAALANIYENTKQYARAISTYDAIPRSSPLDVNIEIRKAFNYNQLEKVDEAKSLLDALAKQHPKEMRIPDAVGNILRARKRFAEAAVYYSRAISLIDKPTKANWNQYYSRGVCYERMKNWPAAEEDLVKSLSLHPDQPLILNYLGYSWVDQNRNLKQAIEYIEKAVRLKPDDGYFIDSLGWAHYRLNDFPKAVAYLERAVELRPEDPTINDHLGDALWRVGRVLEAKFQWSQALTLKPETEEVDRIKRKLEEGLPALKQARTAPRARKETRRTGSRQSRADNNKGGRSIFTPLQ